MALMRVSYIIFGKGVDNWGQLHHNAAAGFQRQPDGLALLSFHLFAGEREAVKSVRAQQ
jgi:hypothetical protein